MGIYNLVMLIFKKQLEFEWDSGNIDKNWQKHRVKSQEAEEVFFNQDKREYPDPKHSKKEIRKVIVGKTRKGRKLFIVYTFRKRVIRIISVRDLNKRKEAELYEKTA
ncbi:hypothetical protein A2W24_04095 [Microgenomates group bacterium RBG_16_45_19]|nr:MAG: hypothetical protein A2W24_04095 [Microgenomates group bacterium RBG_16_45_19]